MCTVYMEQGSLQENLLETKTPGSHVCVCNGDYVSRAIFNFFTVPRLKKIRWKSLNYVRQYVNDEFDNATEMDEC